MEGNNQPMNQINQGQAPMEQISAMEFAAKFKSKLECYDFLALDCDVYLPPYGKSQLHRVLMYLCWQTT